MSLPADSHRRNPGLSPVVRIMTVPVFLVLLIGSLLFIAPGAVAPRWPWVIPPFNARFLGAIYVAEAVTVAFMLWNNRWSPGRLALVIALLFTVPAATGTLIHLNQMFWPGKRVAAWFILYFGYIALPAWALWHYRKLPPVQVLPLPHWPGRIAVALGAALLAYGLLMFAIPTQAASFWPWPVDALHGRIYSGIFLSAGAGLLVSGRGAAREEVQLTGLAVLTLGGAAVASLFLASQATGRSIALSAGTMAWLAVFIALVAVGGTLLAASRDGAALKGE